MREKQSVHAGEWERRSNLESLPPDAGEVTDLCFCILFKSLIFMFIEWQPRLSY